MLFDNICFDVKHIVMTHLRYSVEIDQIPRSMSLEAVARELCLTIMTLFSEYAFVYSASVIKFHLFPPFDAMDILFEHGYDIRWPSAYSAKTGA